MIYEAGPHNPAEVRTQVAAFAHGLFEGRRTMIGRESASHWVEDTPYNLLRFPELLSVFPAAKLVHVVRDPRDVLASYRTFRWGGDDLVATARRLAGIYTRWLHIRRGIPETAFYEVQLEALADDGRRELLGIAAFLELSVEESLLAIPLDQSNSGRWQRELREVPNSKPALAELQPLLPLLGY